MKPLDYSRSFVIGTASRNEVRFWVESRTRIIGEQTGLEEDYIQVGSCKAERTFADSNLFQEDNYDFMPIFGPEYSAACRRKAYLNAEYKQCLRSNEFSWGGQNYYLTDARNAAELPDNEAILAATHACVPLISQTEIWNEKTHLRAIIECPIKTMNTRREGNLYQVDTGPIAFCDLTTRYERNIEGIALAFLAFNAPNFADFVVEVPSAIGSGVHACEVHHYSELLSFTARNTLWSAEA